MDGYDDKENAGAVGGGKGKGSSSGGGDAFGTGTGSVADSKQLSGQKRGGGDIEIEKQKSFTGSYFQVRKKGVRCTCVKFSHCIWVTVRPCPGFIIFGFV